MAKGNKPAPITGDDTDNVLHGTEGHDMAISGYGGNDTLYGYGGDDYLYGHEGNDTLWGGSGNDQLQGHDGVDYLYGGDGADFLAGGGDDDFVFGGAGNDVLGWGNYGHDELTGGSGADRFYSGAWEWTNQQVGTVMIMDFESGVDTLDLTRFDADERTTPGIIKGKNTPGNEAFTVVDSTDGVTPGHLVISTAVDAYGRTVTIVQGYTDTEAGADIEVVLLNPEGVTGPIIVPEDIML